MTYTNNTYFRLTHAYREDWNVRWLDSTGRKPDVDKIKNKINEKSRRYRKRA